jgi:hypothetical protein
VTYPGSPSAHAIASLTQCPLGDGRQDRRDLFSLIAVERFITCARSAQQLLDALPAEGPPAVVTDVAKYLMPHVIEVFVCTSIRPSKVRNLTTGFNVVARRGSSLGGSRCRN